MYIQATSKRESRQSCLGLFELSLRSCTATFIVSNMHRCSACDVDLHVCACAYVLLPTQWLLAPPCWGESSMARHSGKIISMALFPSSYSTSPKHILTGTAFGLINHPCPTLLFHSPNYQGKDPFCVSPTSWHYPTISENGGSVPSDFQTNLHSFSFNPALSSNSQLLSKHSQLTVSFTKTKAQK